MTPCSRWDIVLVPFPFTLPQKWFTVYVLAAVR
jgi:hypothetical protein